MRVYTFIKERTECGNIEGCRFVGDVFRTKELEIAERLRRSATFGKTVSEIDEQAEERKKKEESEIPDENDLGVPKDSKDYEIMTVGELRFMCKNRDLHPYGKRGELIARLCEWDDEHQ